MCQKTFNTFHYHWWVILITTIVIFVIEYLIRFTFLNVSFLNWIYNSGCLNQKFLITIAKESNLSTIIVAVYATLMAPIIEELAYRYALPMICRNRWVGLIIGSFFFGWFHVGGYGDFQNVFYFWIAGLIWNTLFIIMRENFVFGSISHAFFNFSVFFI